MSKRATGQTDKKVTKVAIGKLTGLEKKLLDEIQAVRAANNAQWMQILRIAFRYASGEAKAVMKQITANDRRVSALTARLAGAGGKRGK